MRILMRVTIHSLYCRVVNLRYIVFCERCGDRQIRKPYKKSLRELFYIGFLMQLGESKKSYILALNNFNNINDTSYHYSKS